MEPSQTMLIVSEYTKFHQTIWMAYVPYEFDAEEEHTTFMPWSGLRYSSYFSIRKLNQVMRCTKKIFQLVIANFAWGLFSLQPSLVHKIQGLKPSLFGLEGQFMQPSAATAWTLLISRLVTNITHDILSASNSSTPYNGSSFESSVRI